MKHFYDTKYLINLIVMQKYKLLKGIFWIIYIASRKLFTFFRLLLSNLKYYILVFTFNI